MRLIDCSGRDPVLGQVVGGSMPLPGVVIHLSGTAAGLHRDEGERGGRVARVAVLDDEEPLRSGCRRILEEEGYEVHTASDGIRGWRMLLTMPFDLVLVDLKMPGLDGVCVLRRMKDEMPDVVAVVITGYASYETAVETVKLGAYDYIPKPFTADELKNLVRRGLERRFLKLENRRLREERARHLLDLTHQRSRLLTIINSMADGVLVINRAGQLVLCNPTARRWVLAEDTAFVGDDDAAPLLGQAVRVPEVVDLVDSLASDSRLDQQNVDVKLHEGRYLHACAARVHDRDQHHLGTVVVLRDITQRREIERMKSDFVRTVSHEIRAPLAAVEGYLNLLLGESVGEEDSGGIMTRCLQRIQTLQQFIVDLLDLSRLEAGQVQREVRDCDLAEVLADVVEFQRGAAVDGEIAVKLRLDPEEQLLMRADPRDMDEIFTNLVSNAIRYNVEGGEVKVCGRCEGAHVLVTVQDTGVGMSSEHIGRIFDEFYRVRDSETAHSGGTGLGLAIVRALVREYDGSIEVQSEPGKGTVVRVQLPVRSDD